MNILEEANSITGSDRPRSYGHPLDHFGRTVGMVNARFAHKLKTPLTEEDWGVIMAIDKIARTAQSMKRDTLTDIAGYARTVEMVQEERERRAVEAQGPADTDQAFGARTDSYRG